MVEPHFYKPFALPPTSGDAIVLAGDEGKHAASVRRMRVGEAIALTDGLGVRVRGTVQSVEAKSLVVSVNVVETDAKPKLEITLVQALAKGDRDELAIQAATELGAMAVIPWQAERSISRWDEAKAIKGRVRWQVICDEAAKQSLRSWFPKVSSITSSQQLEDLFETFDKVLVLDPTAEVGIAALGALEGKIAIVVGPEGGIADAELKAFEQAGATRVRLGDSILRTSTAGVVAISALQVAAGYFN